MIRISFIEFLNAVPLGWAFLQNESTLDVRLLFDVPSGCARRLATGGADVGLIPVVEYQRIPGLSVIPGLSIASRQEAKSVLFVSKVPLTEVSRVALDESSRTSAVLLKVLLGIFYRRDEIKYVVQAPHPQKMLENCDAALIIGNPALQLSSSPLLVFDLAQEWHNFTSLPFVFAFWGVRSGLDLSDYVCHFHSSLQKGMRDIDLISQVYGAKLGMPPEEIHAYLTQNLNYELDEENLRGLNAFYELASEVGEIGPPTPIRFCGPAEDGGHAVVTRGIEHQDAHQDRS